VSIIKKTGDENQTAGKTAWLISGSKNSVMPSSEYKDEQQVIGAVKFMPAISIIQPFEVKTALKSETDHALKLVAAEAEKQLAKTYPEEKFRPVIEKLNQLIRHITYDPRKKGIAIFVSPIMEKVFFLDFPAEARLVIDESFEIRDLVYNKKLNTRFLVLLLSDQSFSILLGGPSSMIRIRTGVPENSNAYKRDLPQRVTHFSDTAAEKEILLDKLLQHADEALSGLLKTYALPVFVTGTPRDIGHFKKMTANAKNITAYIHGNYLDASETDLRKVLAPYLEDWRKAGEQQVLQRLERAAGEGRLVQGIRKVWTAAEQKTGQLLVVETDFIYPARQGADAGTIYKEAPGPENAFYLKDAVDDIIEKVLASGGEVEFVGHDLLKDRGHIALVQYFHKA
jgi:hypothetical protein